MLCKAFQYCTKCFFVLLIFFLFLFLQDLNFSWLYFTSSSFISPFCILLIILRALLNLSNFASAVLLLYLYIKLSLLTFLCLNQLFFYTFHLQVHQIFIFGLRSMEYLQHIVIFCNCFKLPLILNCFYLFNSLIFNCFYLFLNSFSQRR